MQLPRFFSVKQDFHSQQIDNVGREVTDLLNAEPLVAGISPGQSVAIAVGSRGIDQIAKIAVAVVEFLINRGADPFIVPAMGSHGGATAEGQSATLAALGITADSVGCPIRSSMETIEIGRSETGIPLHFDQFAAQADHVIAINRIKPHTRLTGSIQSGLCKMLMIGLGKRDGAIAFHPAFKSMDYRLDRITDQVIPTILENTSFLLGIALIENSHDSIGQIEVVAGDQLLTREPSLLKTASDWMPKLPFETAELLIIDAIGKEISGTGLDTNIVGRKYNENVAGDDEWPKIHEIYVRSLSDKTAGNATGIGIAEYTHRRVAETTDLEKTRINCITAGHPTAAAMPVWFDSDREVLSAVCAQAPMQTERRRWIWIRNTLDLVYVRCSEGFLDETHRSPHLESTSPPEPLRFDSSGNLDWF